MGLKAISAHGTLVARQAAGSGGFTTIGELRAITPPPLMRNEIETTAQQDADDFYVAGIRRRGDFTFQIGFAPSGEATHGIASGLLLSWQSGLLDGWRVTYPDNTQWIFSGFIKNVGPSAPLEDGLVADVTIRPSGAMSIT